MPTPEQYRNRYRRIANEKRAIPHARGLREFEVYTVRIQYSESLQRGEPASVVTRITNGGGINPKVRSVNDEQRALSGLPEGSIIVGPITPEYADGTGTGGTPYETLDPELDDGDQFNYVTVGPGTPPGGSRYELVSVDPDHALRFMVTLKRVADGADNAVVGP